MVVSTCTYFTDGATGYQLKNTIMVTLYYNDLSVLAWEAWLEWDETLEECVGENRKRTRMRCSDDGTILIDTNASPCPGK